MLAVLAVAATLDLGVVPSRDAVAQSLPAVASGPATPAAALDAAMLAPIFHALAATPAPAGIDAMVVQDLSARGAAALRAGPYRLRVAVLVGVGSDGLVLEPVRGAPGLQTTVDDIGYALQIASPAAGLLVPEAIAVALGEKLAAGRETAADLVFQIDGVEVAGDGRRVVLATLRQAIVLGVVDAEPVHVIEISPFVTASEPVGAPAPPVQVPPPASPVPAPVAASETVAAPTSSAPLPVAPTEPMGPPLIERLDAPMIVVAGGEVRASPQPSGALLFVVSPGTSVFVTGRVSAEWLQLRLIDGKLAYLPALAFTAPPIVNPLPATSNLAGGTPAVPIPASPALPGPALPGSGQAVAPLAPVSPVPVPAPTIPTPAAAPAATTDPTVAAPAPVPSPAAPPTPAPVETPAPTPPPVVTAAPPPVPSTPTPPAPQPDALAEPVFVAERGGVLRNAASARALQVAQVRAGQRFTLLKEQRSADGQVWAEVKPIDGAPGFLLRKDIIPAEEWDAPVSGAVARVVDAATLVVGARTIRLGAVEAGPVRFVEIVRPWLTGAASPLTCERRPDAAFDCFSADRRDVGETMILNGLARAGAGAPAYYLEAQDKAKQAKKGLWRTAR